uniref:Sulfotransferase domain-containing protein n=1 Tax=Aureoumbra lagunensis TaxID=44058 RepID=A0A7S3NRL8_9STRA
MMNARRRNNKKIPLDTQKDGSISDEKMKYDGDKRKKKGIIAPLLMLAALGGIIASIMYITHEQERRGVLAESPDPKKDILLTSFPKSGSNWARFLVAGLEAGRYEKITGRRLDLTFELAEMLVPDLEFGPNREKFIKGGKSPAFKSHQPYFPSHRASGVGPSDHGSRGRPRCDEFPFQNIERYQCFCPNCPTRYHKFLLVVRDGRSALCSYLHFQRQLGNIAPDTSLKDFLISEKSKYVLPWPDHVLSYLDFLPRHDSLFILKYEDLHDNPLQVVQNLVTWFNRSYTDLDYQRIINQSAFDQMRTIEEQSGTPLFDATYPEARDNGFRLIRHGKPDGWRLCDTNESRINHLFREHLGPRFDEAMRRFGYFK